MQIIRKLVYVETFVFVLKIMHLFTVSLGVHLQCTFCSSFSFFSLSYFMFLVEMKAWTVGIALSSIKLSDVKSCIVRTYVCFPYLTYYSLALENQTAIPATKLPVKRVSVLWA